MREHSVFDIATMSPRLVLLLLSFVVALVVAAPPRDKYTDRFDNINLDQILNNNRILGNYINCLLGKGTCTAEGRELKRTLPDALSTDCSKCNPKQKEAAEKVINFLMKNRRADWDKLEKKFDPSGAYRKRFEANLNSGSAAA
ncbi:hypothetical protein B566_EDAN014478 [Ephemera danica]|nr:hypothetical protein B566_EDAN014478 [Ephemera danica]